MSFVGVLISLVDGHSSFAYVLPCVCHPRLVLSRRPGPPLDWSATFSQTRQAIMPGARQATSNVIVAQAYEEYKQPLMEYLGYKMTCWVQAKLQRSVSRVAGNSVQETLDQLEQQYGLERDLLPQSLGGNYDYSKLDEWIRMRLSVEYVMHCAPLPQSMDLKQSARCRHSTTRRSGSSSPGNTPSDNSSGGEQSPSSSPVPKKKKRKLSINEDIENLDYQVRMHRLSNEMLKGDNRRLESALAQARLIIAQQSANNINDDWLATLDGLPLLDVGTYM